MTTHKNIEDAEKALEEFNAMIVPCSNLEENYDTFTFDHTCSKKTVEIIRKALQNACARDKGAEIARTALEAIRDIETSDCTKYVRIADELACETLAKLEGK